MAEQSEYKKRFIDVYKANIDRAGSEKLLEWLLSTDFFDAPASTRFHNAFKEGLVMHSLNVYDVLKARVGDTESAETVAIVSLLHDVCKARFYKESTRNVKNEQTGAWDKVPYYSIEDQFPFGHGEKSVFLIERFMKLNLNEAIAIRWHMGGFDDNAKAGGFSVSAAFQKYPLAVHMHIADVEATYLVETK